MNDIERMVLEKLKTLLLKRVKVHKLILFGSRARGDADPESDMDVLVVLEENYDNKIREYISDCAWEAGIEHGIVIVSVVYSRDDWENGPEHYSPLAQAVEAEGIPL